MKTTLLLLACALFYSSPSSAEVYRWVDEKGVTHYGDKPPELNGKSKKRPRIDKMDFDGSKIFSSVKQRQAIRYDDTKRARLVLFEELQIKLKRSERKDLDVGTYTKTHGSLCSNPERIIWVVGFKDISESGLMSDIIGAFKKENYRMITSNMFSISSSSSRLLLTATMTRLRIDICEAYKRTSSSKSHEKASVYVRMNWRLSERSSKKVLFTGSSEGAVNAFDRFRKDGTAKAVTQAIKMSALNLLAKKTFVEHMKPTAEDAQLAAKESQQLFTDSGLKLALQYGDASSSFKKEVPKLKKAAVTIRVAGGHGSGVILDKAGYILTNAHVVGDNKEVVVLVNQLELPGKVIRTEPQRDVALIQVQKLTTAESAVISQSPLTEGDTIYVIGTPLDESLSNTITKGVYSAYREHEGLSYYQTDAAINPGNSGGPVFNDQGELIALSVAGVFTKSGASLNLNYLIPIDAALKSLNIEKQRDVTHLMDVSSTPAATTAAESGINQKATDAYLQALKQKRQGNFQQARAKLKQALAFTNKNENEFQVIQDELNIELPMDEARHFLQAHDEIKVTSILEPVIGYLKNHPKRLVYMKQVEQILTSVRYLKKSKSVASMNSADSLKRILKQYFTQYGEYPKSKTELIKVIGRYSEFKDLFEIRSYTSGGYKYKLIVYDKKFKQQHILEDG